MIVVPPEIYNQLVNFAQKQQFLVNPIDKIFGEKIIVDYHRSKSTIYSTERFVEYESGDDWAVWCGFAQEIPNILIINDNNSSSRRILNLKRELTKIFGI